MGKQAGTNADPSLIALQQRLGHAFRSPALLVQALTHSSAVSGPANTAVISNERLEFLGDRVLGLAMAGLLYKRFGQESEGALSRRFAAMVRRETLAGVANALDLGTALILADAEAENGGRRNPTILADACEAVIAALYLDDGFACAEAFVARQWSVLIGADVRPPKDAKTALQEWALARGLGLPLYREVGRSGPAHAPEFVIQVAVPGHAPGRAAGTSKRAAEQSAAAALLAMLRGKDAERDER